MESCKEFIRMIVRSLIEWRAERSFIRRIVLSLIEWRAVRSLLGVL